MRIIAWKVLRTVSTHSLLIRKLVRKYPSRALSMKLVIYIFCSQRSSIFRLHGTNLLTTIKVVYEFFVAFRIRSRTCGYWHISQ